MGAKVPQIAQGGFVQVNEQSYSNSAIRVLRPRVFDEHVYACRIFYMPIRRTTLFLKEQQMAKLQKLYKKTGAPVAELIRRAIDAYLLSRKKELK